MKNNSLFSAITYKETGLRHIKKGKGCEDNVYYTFSDKSGVKVITLSDGAGSYSNAAIGSELSSRIAGDFIAEKFDLLYDLDRETTGEFILHEILSTLNTLANKSGNDLLSYSATLLCAAFHPDGRYILFHVGDGAIVGLNMNNKCETISIYDHDGPANQATFVTVENTDFFLKKGVNEYISFVLMSDGPEDFLVNELEVNPRVNLMIQLSFFVSESNMMEQLASLIRLLKEKGMGDDASFALLNDTRYTSVVFNSLNPELRATLFDLGSDIGTKKLKTATDVLDIISLSENGATIKQIYRQLHVHSEKNAKKKIEFLIKMNLIERINGKYYIAK